MKTADSHLSDFTRRGARGALMAGLTLAAMVMAGPRGAAAQAPCSAVRSETPAPSSSWAPPLGRSITLQLNGPSLRDALERVAAAAEVRLSYSSDRLPSIPEICAAFDGVPLGQALTSLLGGASLEPVAAGSDLVVLAPVKESHLPARETEALAPPELPLFTLEPMVVRVDTRASEERTSPVSTKVISGDELRRQGVSSWVTALNGSVPGLWSWQSWPGGLSSGFGSVRGASSFGLQAPKVYIDGIEVANPLLSTHLNPDAIERVEVIRGPEGSALYGAGAIAGVTNIVTRHDWGGDGASRLKVRSSFGFSGSDFAPGSAFAQDHAVSLALGSPRRSANLNLALGEEPEVVPGGTARHLGLDGSFRVVGSHALLTGTLRLSDDRATLSPSPLLDTPIHPLATGGAADQLGLASYTAGLRALIDGGGSWTHTLVAGVDGYGLAGFDQAHLPLLSPTDSALLAAGAGATRATLSLSSSRPLDLGEDMSSTLTLGLEQSLLFRQSWPFDPGFSSASGDNGRAQRGLFRPVESTETSPSPASISPSPIWDTGVSGRLVTTLFDRLFVTTGLRLEHDLGSAVSSRVAALPNLGASLSVGELGPVDVKLRSAYGRAIRWPQMPTAVGPGAVGGRQLGLWSARGGLFGVFALGPEQQSGVESGIDLSMGSSAQLSVTRFDQTSRAFVESSPPSQDGAEAVEPQPGGAHLLYPGETVGEIGNRGWELEGSLRQGPLSLSGTLSLVDSRVLSLGPSYQGDLLPGDRMLGVPARTLGLSATWSASTWSTSLGLSRAFDWVGYDRVALESDFGSSPEGVPSTGLRDYWRSYDGFTHLRLGLSRMLTPDVTLLLSVENLLDRQVGEPDNATVVPGRTVSLGVSAGLPWLK